MQPLQASYNIDFLNNYFTTKEFNFINNSNSENQELNNLILKETNIRDTIVNFINNLNDSISDNNYEKSNSDFSQLLSEVQEIFEKINDNIRMVQDLKLVSEQISDKVVNLLIQIESKPDSPESYAMQIQELKDSINEFSIKNNDIRSKVLLNDIKVDRFFQKSIVKKYLSTANIEIKPTKEEIQKENQEQFFYAKEAHNHSSSIHNDKIIEENHTLLISEKLKKVFLPYSKQEILSYLEQYPNEYKSFQDVINKEFILPLDYYIKHPVVARFRETYSLIRDRESKSVIDAFKFALDLMFNYSLNPAIIAACKTQEQLENYLSCLDRKKLDEFTDFEIKFEIAPLNI